MPFDFLRRKRDDVIVTVTPAAPSAEVVGRGTVFDGYTDEWRLVGEMAVEGRLSDALNKRDPITISKVRWAAIDGSTPLTDAPGLQSVDPYDLIIVVAGEGSLPPMSDDERRAHRIHKVHYELALEAPPFRIVGTVQLFPGPIHRGCWTARATCSCRSSARARRSGTSSSRSGAHRTSS